MLNLRYKRAADDTEHSEIGTPALAAAGASLGTSGVQLGLGEVLSGGKAATPEQIKRLQKVMGGRHVQFGQMSGAVREQIRRIPMLGKLMERNFDKGGYIPGGGWGPESKSPLSLPREVRREGVATMYGREQGSKRMRGRAARRGFIIGKNMAPEVAAHELGHATGRHKLYGMQAAAKKWGAWPTMIGGYIAGKHYGGDSESGAGAAARGSLGGAAASLPMAIAILPEEIRATGRAFKALRRTGVKGLAPRARLIAALGTYLLGALGIGATAGVFGALRARAKKKNKPIADKKRQQLIEKLRRHKLA
jgi:hypothetical protein